MFHVFSSDVGGVLEVARFVQSVSIRIPIQFGGPGAIFPSVYGKVQRAMKTAELRQQAFP